MSAVPLADAQPIGVMHLVDTLLAAGTERVAVNLANLLPRSRFRSFLCTTRQEGPLAKLVAADVGRLQLDRNKTVDLAALRRLVKYVAANQIEILHAHSTSVLVACAASLWPPYPKVVWHDHYGMYAVLERPVWMYRTLARRMSGVVAVNQPLLEWSRDKLHVPSDRVWYVPNFVCPPAGSGPVPSLPGSPERRVVCVANFREQKDHLNLVTAMAEVVKAVPDAHLLLVGRKTDGAYVKKIEQAIGKFGLRDNIHFLGSCDNVYDILRASAVGVIASKSEGLPLSLLEYGTAGLAVVSTTVGQCPEVLDHGNVGMLVPPGAAGPLADRLTALLQSAELRASLGNRLQDHIDANYSMGAAVNQISQVYDTVLGRAASAPADAQAVASSV